MQPDPEYGRFAAIVRYWRKPAVPPGCHRPAIGNHRLNRCDVETKQITTVVAAVPAMQQRRLPHRRVPYRDGEIRGMLFGLQLGDGWEAPLPPLQMGK